MPFASCSMCGCAWDPGESDEADHVKNCPRCAITDLRDELECRRADLIEIRDKIEKTGQPCVMCGWTGDHKAGYEEDADLACILGELDEAGGDDG